MASMGKIVFRNVKLRYRQDLPLVLKNLSITIDAGEKVGICGRTGAGKSSLLVALFRLFEPESGSSIMIDGVEILKSHSELGSNGKNKRSDSGMALKTLRSRIGIIPQDPVMFSGTLRDNLDPFGDFTDEQLWGALRMVQLDTLVHGFAQGLQHLLSADGSNLSHGQRQLMCISRVLLRKTKILMCDEATSSVDSATDALVQKVIREGFGNSTVLTIAHRLETILDCSRVLVLANGEVAEFASPKKLLSDSQSQFSQMANGMEQTL